MERRASGRCVSCEGPVESARGRGNRQAPRSPHCDLHRESITPQRGLLDRGEDRAMAKSCGRRTLLLPASSRRWYFFLDVASCSSPSSRILPASISVAALLQQKPTPQPILISQHAHGAHIASSTVDRVLSAGGAERRRPMHSGRGGAISSSPARSQRDELHARSRSGHSVESVQLRVHGGCGHSVRYHSRFPEQLLPRPARSRFHRRGMGGRTRG